MGPAEAAIALEHRDVLGQLGLRIEPFGGDTVLITGFPAMLANMNPGEMLHALLERLVSGGGQPDRRDLLDDLLHTVACKAAIKAGDRLTAAEIAALLEQRHRCWTRTTAPTAGPPSWSSPARSWTSSSSERRQPAVLPSFADRPDPLLSA